VDFPLQISPGRLIQAQNVGLRNRFYSGWRIQICRLVKFGETFVKKELYPDGKNSCHWRRIITCQQMCHLFYMHEYVKLKLENKGKSMKNSEIKCPINCFSFIQLLYVALGFKRFKKSQNQLCLQLWFSLMWKTSIFQTMRTMRIHLNAVQYTFQILPDQWKAKVLQANMLTKWLHWASHNRKALLQGPLHRHLVFTVIVKSQNYQNSNRKLHSLEDIILKGH
jgi:hypothetical protein